MPKVGRIGSNNRLKHGGGHQYADQRKQSPVQVSLAVQSQHGPAAERSWNVSIGFVQNDRNVRAPILAFDQSLQPRLISARCLPDHEGVPLDIANGGAVDLLALTAYLPARPSGQPERWVVAWMPGRKHKPHDRLSAFRVILLCKAWEYGIAAPAAKARWKGKTFARVAGHLAPLSPTGDKVPLACLITRDARTDYIAGRLEPTYSSGSSLR